MILSKIRDPRFVTIRRGGTLSDSDHHLLALWAASCAEHVLDLFESAQPGDLRPRQAIEGARGWVRGEVKMMEARAMGGHATGAARDLHGAARHAAYAAGQAGAAQTALVIGAEKLSDFTDWTDRTTCVLVGDGAGALVLKASASPGVGPVHWGSVPELSHAVRIEQPTLQFQQEGMSVFRWAISQAAKLARRTCEMAGVLPEELAGFVPHQANLRIIEPLADQLGIPHSITARDVVTSGNTSSASVPIALAKLVRAGQLPPDSPVLLFGFGGGFSYAGQVIRTPRNTASIPAGALPLF
jgi:hypothetical protein